MTEQYKPWEGKRFLGQLANIRYEIKELAKSYNDDWDIQAMARRLQASVDVLTIAIETDWDEQEKEKDG